MEGQGNWFLIAARLQGVVIKFQYADMLPVDHIPFACRDLALLGATFERLGFFVSPRAEFRSPDAPGEVWPTRGVFLEGGWFDLQAVPSGGTDRLAGPRSCLFRARDLESAAKALQPLRLDPPFRLTRHWDEPPKTPALSMAYANLRARIAPLMLAIIAYDDQGSDVDPHWTRHPNSALEILGLAFPAPAPGPAAEAAARVLDLSGFRYGAPGTGVRVRVGDLDRTAECLTAGLVEFSRSGPEIHVPAFDILECTFSFST